MKHSFWITSDGTTAECLTLTYRDRLGFTLSASTLSAIIEAEIGLAVEIEN